MEYQDYYKIMGVERDATADDIKRAYRKLARKYHPDVSKEPDAEKRFKQMKEAYEVLKDTEKRAAYDQLGANWQSGQNFNPPPGWDAGFEYSGGFDDAGGPAFSDFFESLFGQKGRHQHTNFKARGQDHHARILIELEDSFDGNIRNITLQSPMIDDQGHIRTQDRTLSVRIPKGICQGQHIRLSGQGTLGMGGEKAGDLYLEVEFKAHNLYRVDGRDLFLELPVTPWEAALGAKIKVPTPGGNVDLTLSPNSKPGKKLRLKGRGIPGKKSGDLYVILGIQLPPVNDERAAELYQQMQQHMDFNPRAHLGV